MAKMTPVSIVKFELTVTLSEAEARALVALASYGIDSVIQVVQDNISQYYIRDHGRGFTELLTSARESVPPFLRRVDAARESFKNP